MVEELIAAFTPVIVRGGIYQTSLSFLDADEVPIPILAASFIGTPDGAVPFTWDTGNNLFINISTGVWRFNLFEADTTALVWDSGSYRIEVVDVSGFTIPCIIEGLMFATDCNA